MHRNTSTPARTARCRTVALQLAAVLALLSTGCSTATATGASSADSSAGVHAVLNDIVAAWNRDDLAGHVGPYTESATYTQPNGLMVGRPAITAMLQGAFGRPDGLAGDLAFNDVLVRMLGDDSALATGSFVVSKLGTSPDIKGRFTLVFSRVNGKWMIIHDHSS